MATTTTIPGAEARRLIDQLKESLEDYRQYLLREHAGSAGEDDPVDIIDALAAYLGVSDYSFRSQPGGGAEVRIDGKTIELPPALARLLEVLAADDGSSSDHLVEWKTMEDVIAALAKRDGGIRKPHAVNQAKSRLRGTFRADGLNRHLIMTNSRHEMRFALPREVARALA